MNETGRERLARGLLCAPGDGIRAAVPAGVRPSGIDRRDRASPRDKEKRSVTKLHTRRGGFTLIELMIVVAIIGILAAIAIPNFLRFQLKAKSSEGKTNLAAIRTAEESYAAQYATYVVAGMAPGASVGTLSGDKQNWLTVPPGFAPTG